MKRAAEELWLPCGRQTLYARWRRSPPGKPLVIMLCGIGFHTFEYEGLCSLLGEAGCGTLTFDYRGHGRSSGRRGHWTLVDLQADACRVIEHARARHDGPVLLFGNSLGAMVAMRVASHARGVVGVAASNAPARLGDFMLTPGRRALLGLSRFVPAALPIRLSLKHFYGYAQLIDDTSWLRKIERDRAIADARRLSLSTYRSLLLDWDGPAVAAQLSLPLLLLQGRHDRMQPPQQAELLLAAAREPKRLVMLDTGHLPHLEHPAAVCDAVLAWMAETLPGLSMAATPGAVNHTAELTARST